MEEIGVALVGYGLAGSIFHAPLIATTQGLRLRAVVTNDPQRKLQVEQDFPQVRSVPTLEQLLDDTADIGLVVIATPNHMHLWQATAALAHGLHVVVDKPMALSSSEASAMIAVAQRSGRLLSVFQNRRFDNDYLLVRQLIADHRIEMVRHFESRFERWRPELRPGSWREERTPEDGWGAAAGPGQPPHRPGPAAIRPTAGRLRRDRHPPAESPGRRRLLHRSQL